MVTRNNPSSNSSKRSSSNNANNKIFMTLKYLLLNDNITLIISSYRKSKGHYINYTYKII